MFLTQLAIHKTIENYWVQHPANGFYWRNSHTISTKSSKTGKIIKVYSRIINIFRENATVKRYFVWRVLHQPGTWALTGMTDAIANCHRGIAIICIILHLQAITLNCSTTNFILFLPQGYSLDMLSTWINRRAVYCFFLPPSEAFPSGATCIEIWSLKEKGVGKNAKNCGKTKTTFFGQMGPTFLQK